MGGELFELGLGGVLLGLLLELASDYDVKANEQNLAERFYPESILRNGK